MNPKLLIVENNTILRETMRGILELKFPALRVFEAEGEKESLSQINEHEPDLILMDIRLSDGDGLKLTRKLRDSHPEIVIIIFTNYDLPEYRKAAFENGADFFFSKSSPDRRTLTKMVGSILTDAGFKLK